MRIRIAAAVKIGLNVSYRSNGVLLSVGTILGSEPASKRQRTNSRGNRNRRPSLGSRPSPPFSWFTPASLPDRPSFAGWSSGRIRAYRMGWEDAMRAIEMGVFGYGDQQCEWQCEINQLAIFHCLRRIPEA